MLLFKLTGQDKASNGLTTQAQYFHFCPANLESELYLSQLEGRRA